MTDLPTPAPLGLPREAVVAVPADGLTVYRLVRSDPPTLRDFLPPSPELAAQRGWPELLRAGLSHFLTAEQAGRARRHRVSRIARVDLATARDLRRTNRPNAGPRDCLGATGGPPRGRAHRRLTRPSPTMRRMTVFSLFSGADLVGEFETGEEAERALDEAVAANPSAVEELAVIEFDENGECVGEPITRAAA